MVTDKKANKKYIASKAPANRFRPTVTSTADQPSKTHKSTNSKMLLYLIVIVVAILLMIILFLLYFHFGTSPIIQLLITNKQISLAQLNRALILQHQYSKNNNLNLSYSAIGYFVLPTGRLTIPFKLYTSNYGNDTREVIAVDNFSLGSDYTLTARFYIIKNNNQTYICDYVKDPAFALSPSIDPAEASNAGCYNLSKYIQQSANSTFSTLNTSNKSLVENLSAIVENGIYITVNSISLNSHEGCAFADGNVIVANQLVPSLIKAISQSSGSTISSTLSSYLDTLSQIKINGTYSTCISKSYFVPITFNMTENIVIPTNMTGYSANHAYDLEFGLSMKNTNISVENSKSFVTSLPYPIINGTCTSNYSYYSQLYSDCSYPTLNTSGALSVAMNFSKQSIYNYGNSANQNNYEFRITGLYCLVQNPYYYNSSSPNVSRFTAVNITEQLNMGTTLYFSCNANYPIGTGSTFGLWAVITNSSNYSSQMQLATATVNSSTSNGLGVNVNSGPVAKTVTISPLVASTSINTSTNSISAPTKTP